MLTNYCLAYITLELNYNITNNPKASVVSHERFGDALILEANCM